MSDDLDDASDIDTTDMSMAHRLRAMSHTAVCPDLLHVGISGRSVDWWAAYPGTGNYDARARREGRAGWFVTDASGHVLRQLRFADVEARERADAEHKVAERGKT